MNKKISVIIPVYNSEKFLERCINSLVNQKLKDIEFIFIDDGSSDKSTNIIRKFAKNDDRIILINKENGGVSSARNLGLEYASGEYIGFVDSDDWIDLEMYSDFYKKAKENYCDIIMCSIVREDANHVQDYEVIDIKKDVVLENIIDKPKYFMSICGSACKAIYKRDLLIKNNIKFPVGIKLSEDKIFNFYAVSKSKRIMYIDKYYYHYYENNNSAVRSYRKNMLNDVLEAKHIQDIWISNLGESKYNYIDIYDNQFIVILIQCVMNEFKADNNINLYKKYKNIKRILNNENVIGFIKNISIKNILNKKYYIKYFCIRKKLAITLTIIGLLKHRY